MVTGTLEMNASFFLYNRAVLCGVNHSNPAFLYILDICVSNVFLHNVLDSIETESSACHTDYNYWKFFVYTAAETETFPKTIEQKCVHKPNNNL